MCGIAGFIGKGDFNTGIKMINEINYRGPDFSDVYFHNDICLAHSRLSIIDVDARSNQPFFSQDKKHVIIFNGEIYNYKVLKNELLNTGKYQFLTESDTEVLLYSYIEYGFSFLKKIDGMFSFAIYDFIKQQLILARDRMGKKPLYYTQCKDRSFVFASELKAILKHPSVERKINIEAINQYLTFDYVPTPNSINSNVYKLEPAQYLVVQNSVIKEKSCYWEHNFETNHSIKIDNAISELDYHLDLAVRKRLVSDVPLGVFLSGGLDSSSIAYYAQKNSTNVIKSFSIGFEDTSYDEQNYALQVAKFLNTDHNLEVLTPTKTLQLIDEIFPLMDEPFADASIIPTYFLSKFTKRHVTVALGGDGSDEILAGYPTFISDKFISFFNNLPKPYLNLLLSVSEALPASDKNISFDFKLKQFLRGFQSGSNHIHQLWLGSFLPEEKERLFRNEIFHELNDKSGLSLIDNHFNKNINNRVNRLIYYYCQTYLLDDILVKIDRASMYNSLEVRAPFLDKGLVEFANSLPPHFKHNCLSGKYILKKLMKGKLPNDIIYRPKKGFGIPISNWIRNELKPVIQETLTHEDDLFNHKFINKILSEHHSKKQNHRKLIWNLFVLKRTLIENNYSI
jgi:asparagine synthase (glutamine-hydrolysing)